MCENVRIVLDNLISIYYVEDDTTMIVCDACKSLYR